MFGAFMIFIAIFGFKATVLALCWEALSSK